MLNLSGPHTYPTCCRELFGLVKINPAHGSYRLPLGQFAKGLLIIPKAGYWIAVMSTLGRFFFRNIGPIGSLLPPRQNHWAILSQALAGLKMAPALCIRHWD